MIDKKGSERFVAIRRYDSKNIDDTIYIINPSENDGMSFEDNLIKDPTTEFYRFELGERVSITRVNETIVAPFATKDELPEGDNAK